ncbi:MAG: 4-hydroxy-2-oxovalerate aldolase [bacterium]
MSRSIDILECTLRDGSYAIDYQFTAEDTAIISAGLEAAGFKFIEIGHGLGFSASSAKHGFAAENDEDYIIAAKNTLRKARFGMFCIPGTANLRDIGIAAKHGMGFIRIGVNVTEIEKAEPFIKKAKNAGMLVFSNLMKSYAVTPKEFAHKVKLAYQYGADVICVVDSAGGMLPNDVREYITVVKNETDARIGFHGHNNLHLAEANAIEAVNAGASIIDTSLLGMGRSAGNAQTELMVILLEKLGFNTGIDLYQTLDLGEKVIKPIVGEHGVDSISAIVGAAQFHSSFMKIVNKVSKIYSVDIRQLITEVSKIDRINVTEELASRVAQKLKPIKKKTKQIHFELDLTDFMKQVNPSKLDSISKNIINEMFMLSKKTGRKTVFTISKSLDPLKKSTTFPFIRYNENYIVGNAELKDDGDALEIMNAIDGTVDFMLIDFPLWNRGITGKKEWKSKTLPYNDLNAQAMGTVNMIVALTQRISSSVLVTGNNYLTKKLILDLLYFNYKVYTVETTLAASKEYNSLPGNLKLFSSEYSPKIDFIVGLTPYKKSIQCNMLSKTHSNSIIIDAGPMSIAEDVLNYAHKHNLKVFKIDMRAGLFGEIETTLKTHLVTKAILGKDTIRGARVIAGGFIGKKGDIVLDSIQKPTRILGVSDGKGGLLNSKMTQNYRNKLQKVKLAVTKSIFE